MKSRSTLLPLLAVLALACTPVRPTTAFEPRSTGETGAYLQIVAGGAVCLDAFTDPIWSGAGHGGRMTEWETAGRGEL